MDYKEIDVYPLTPRLGAEIHGVDISKPLPDEQLGEVKLAFANYKVIFFRDQDLDAAALKAFGSQFGELCAHAVARGIEGHPEVQRMHADENSKMVAGEDWHSDATCDEEPPMGSVLYLSVVPPVGGDTMFADMAAAYDALSDKMKSYIDGMYAVHDAEHVYRAASRNPNRIFPRSTHPVVRTHPLTGQRCIYVNSGYTTHIEGVSRDESDAILGYLFKHCVNPRYQARFRWSPGAVAFWDNRCAQHTAIFDYFPERRSGLRITLAGDKPV